MTSPERRTPALAMPGVGEPPRPRVPVPSRTRLSNGLRVVAIPLAGLPQVALRLVLPAGAAEDPAEYPGTAALVASLLTEGTRRWDAETLNARLDLLGAAVHTQVGHDFAEVDLSTLSETLPEALELLAEVVVAPGFPEAETERVRAETLDSLEARLDEPANVADDVAAVALFGPEHPYGRLTSGTTEGVSTVPRERLVRFHAERYRPDGSVLIVAGDFDAGTLDSQLEKLFAGWTGTASARTPVPDTITAASAGERLVVGWEDAAQGEIRVTGPGIPRNHVDWVPAAVANYILGGSTITSRLGANLREDRGWTYGVRSGYAAAVGAGGWVVETAVDVDVSAAALEEILSEIARFRDVPVAEDELRRAKDALALSLPRAFETPGRIVGRFATMEAFGLPGDYWERFAERVDAVTAADVSRIAREHLDPAGLVSVIVGTAEPMSIGTEGT